jgi:hypothetical protein
MVDTTGEGPTVVSQSHGDVEVRVDGLLVGPVRHPKESLEASAGPLDSQPCQRFVDAASEGRRRQVVVDVDTERNGVAGIAEADPHGAHTGQPGQHETEGGQENGGRRDAQGSRLPIQCRLGSLGQLDGVPQRAHQST